MITLEKAQEITREKVATLRPEFSISVNRWLQDSLKYDGVIVYIYEGYRTPQRQEELYTFGRTKPNPESKGSGLGTKVTNARAYQSFHQFGLAIDWVPLVLIKDGFYEAGWAEQALYKKAQFTASKYGLSPISWELPHLERSGLKIADLQERYNVYTGSTKAISYGVTRG